MSVQSLGGLCGDGAWSGDDDDAVGGAGLVGPRLLDPGKGEGPGADVEGALGDLGGELRNLLGEVASRDRADAAADDFQPGRAQRCGRDGASRPPIEPISIQVSWRLRSSRAVSMSVIARAAGGPQT
jgi:hypothetical protein